MTQTRQADLDPRKAAVLAAIVREYVSSAEPVGSKRIVEAYALNVSAATVRNDMAALEDAGYIAQPHTSAGRVPTDKGYRFFVDALGEPNPMGENETLAVQGFLAQARDLEDLLVRTTQVLSQLTRHASLALAPALDRSRLKLVELVGLTATNVLLLLIADTGRVEKRVLDLGVATSDADLSRARTILNEAAAGKQMSDVAAALERAVSTAPEDLRDLLTHVSQAVSTGLVQPGVDRVFIAGQAALAGESGFASVDLHRLFELLEEQVTLGRVLAESAVHGGPFVRIGGENEPEELRVASIVGTAYGAQPMGSLGVIGPTRMDYPQVLAAVRVVADHLQSTLGALTETSSGSTT